MKICQDIAQSILLLILIQNLLKLQKYVCWIRIESEKKQEGLTKLKIYSENEFS